MKLKIAYSTKEREWLGERHSRPILKNVELKPIAIVRHIAAQTEKGNRYHYDGIFEPPADADFIFEHKGMQIIKCGINRRINPHFNPKKLKFDGHLAELKDQ